jgi:nicotinate-nucleotide pyrophosphorylase (carboxylating)
MTELAPGLPRDYVVDLVERALREDVGDVGDVTTTATVPAGTTGVADFVPRKPGVVAGLPVAQYVFERVGQGRVEWQERAEDGAWAGARDVIATVEGPVRDILTAERTALNILCHLSGVATVTHQWVAAVEGTGAQIRDTRKTNPGLRLLEKYAVRAGGGVNHRMSLSDAALVKDNHVAAAGGVVAAFDAVRSQYPGLPLEIEVDSIEQARAVIDAGAELVLLDNMEPWAMATVVAYARGRAVRLEASGGLTLEVARAVADTGVDYLAVGALTHSAPVLDIGLDLRIGI